MKGYSTPIVMGVALLRATASAYSTIPPPSSQKCHNYGPTCLAATTNNNKCDDSSATGIPTRAAFLKKTQASILFATTTTVAGFLLVGTPPAAAAAVLDEDRAWRTVRASQRKLGSTAVAQMVQESDYGALQQLLRQPPVSDIRKACSQLAKENAELQERYKTFIAALEQMDTTAMVAIRGRKIGEFELEERYTAVVAALGDFAVSAAAPSAEIVEMD